MLLVTYLLLSPGRVVFFFASLQSFGKYSLSAHWVWALVGTWDPAGDRLYPVVLWEPKVWWEKKMKGKSTMWGLDIFLAPLQTPSPFTHLSCGKGHGKCFRSLFAPGVCP